MTQPLTAFELRHNLSVKQIPRQRISIILDEILDTYNIGSIFRIAESIAAEKVYLCGNMERPPNNKIKRASVNTTEYVPWEAVEDVDLLIKILKPNTEIVSAEIIPEAMDFKEYRPFKENIALVLGNETKGIKKSTLALSDAIIKIPMFGYNNSLNVGVAAGIIAHELVRKIPLDKRQVVC